ncbi:MAG: response regulator [bacterium]|nr:response regulator [bacterium]
MSSETSLHILIVDDEDIIHRTLGMFLEELGHTIDGAWNGISALEAIEANNYDLALVDLRMPGMDGLVLLERVREVRPNLPTVVMTGHGDPAMAERAAELGALDFLTKPVGLMDLMDLLEKIARPKNQA